MNSRKFLITILFVLGFSAVFAQHETLENEKFDPGKFIIHHVMDSYEWHMATFGDFELSIPLPVIVYSKERHHWYVFFSNKLRDGKEYKGFFIHHGEPYDGKVVEKNAQGQIVRPIDLSITKVVLAIWISIALLIWMFSSFAKKYKSNPLDPPKGFRALMEPLILFIRDDVAKSAIGEEEYERFTPFLLTVFFFIFLNNLMGLIPIFPGGANVTGNIAVTAVLALFTFVITTINGTKHYWKHIFWNPDVPWWLKVPLPLMPLVELLGVFTKPTVLMIRLFANVLGGHIVMITFFTLIFVFGGISVAAGYGVSVLSVAFTVFISFLEMLVAFIQAYVFTLLSAIYFGMAIEKDH